MEEPLVNKKEILVIKNTTAEIKLLLNIWKKKKSPAKKNKKTDIESMRENLRDYFYNLHNNWHIQKNVCSKDLNYDNQMNTSEPTT